MALVEIDMCVHYHVFCLLVLGLGLGLGLGLLLLLLLFDTVFFCSRTMVDSGLKYSQEYIHCPRRSTVEDFDRHLNSTQPNGWLYSPEYRF